MNITHIEPVKTGRITDNLYVIKSGPVNFFIYKCDDGVICIDSGFSKSQTIRQLKKTGIDPESITHLFLTHSDVDHTGGTELFENARIYISTDEEQMINGKRTRLFGIMRNPRIKKPYIMLNDSDEVDIGTTKIRGISTPGHTPGSMSYLVGGSILFVGDALKLLYNKAYPLRNYINSDTRQAKGSIRKLARLEKISIMCTAHTGYTRQFDEVMGAWKGS